MKKLLPLLFLSVLILLVACSPGVNLKNGENFFCTDRSYFDILETNPLEVRFTCTSGGEDGFEVNFNGPQDENLIEVLRSKNDIAWGMGVIIVDGQVVQIYEKMSLSKYTSHWE